MHYPSHFQTPKWNLIVVHELLFCLEQKSSFLGEATSSLPFEIGAINDAC